MTVANNSFFIGLGSDTKKVSGVDAPPILVTSDSAVEPIEMPGSDGNWLTSRFVSSE